MSFIPPSIPTEVCTIISDPSCQITQSPVCDPVAMELGNTCLLTVRRAFSGSGTYCMNLTLADDASLALTSTLVSINSRSKFCFMVVRTFHVADKACV